MSTGLAIKIEGVGKRYMIGKNREGSLRGALTNVFRFGASRDQEFWALEDISFDVNQGDVVGIVGKNGAGKSTLLKILSKITRPTRGRIEISGRVASLLEVGTGFHAELTGRENIYLNGTILGMSRNEVKDKFDEIVDFSGIEQFIDTPVKHYSSGMYVRLAFAVAAHLEPEILVIDEVLAVGDAEFQKKCIGKMDDVAHKEGRTVLFVSHNLGMVKSLCSRGILLQQGRLILDSDTNSVVKKYLDSATLGSNIEEIRDRGGSGEVRIEGISVRQESGGADRVMCGADAEFHVRFKAEDDSLKKIRGFVIGLSIYNNDNQFVTVLNNRMSNYIFKDMPTSGEVSCKVPRLPLMGGKYHIDAILSINGVASDIVKNAYSFEVENSDFYESGYSNWHDRQGAYIEQIWQI